MVRALPSPEGLRTGFPGVWTDARSAMQAMSKRSRPLPNIRRLWRPSEHLNFAREEFVSGRKHHRVDAENIVGHNLRS
jgi:hypothetical protein